MRAKPELLELISRKIELLHTAQYGNYGNSIWQIFLEINSFTKEITKYVF